MLESYRQHVAERAAQGVAPTPLNAEQVAALVELLKNPPAGEEELLLDLLANRIPPGVDEAAYVKAGFLAAVGVTSGTSPFFASVYTYAWFVGLFVAGIAYLILSKVMNR